MASGHSVSVHLIMACENRICFHLLFFFFISKCLKMLQFNLLPQVTTYNFALELGE